MGIIKLFRKKYLFIINLLLIFSYYLQYSEYNKKIIPYFRNIEGLKRENELLPFAVVGFTLKALNVLKILENYKFNSFIMCILIYNFTIDNEIFRNILGFLSWNKIKCSCCLYSYSFFFISFK